MKPKITTLAIAIFFALTLVASKGAAQCSLTATGDLEPLKTATGVNNPDPANITKPNQSAAVGGEAEIWVYPTNNLTTDPCNIQWAVNNVAKDGKVLLKQYAKGTYTHTNFNFGDPDFVKTVDSSGTTISHNGPILRVNILRDLTIKGEINSHEANGKGVKTGTTVWGGNYTFLIGNKVSVPPIEPSVTIQDIRFDGAAPGPIKFNAGQDYNEISGCSIVNYKFGQVPNGNITGAFPIIAHGGDDPKLLTGTFKVMDNFIGAPDPKNGPYNNVMHISNADLDLTISGNTIEDTYFLGIAVFGNIGNTTIANNTINKEASGPLEGAAISVGATSTIMFSDKAYDGTTVIKDNTITASSPNSAGILLLLYPKAQYSVAVPQNLAYEVSDNVITMNNGKAALACIGACSKTIWKNNTVKGSGGYGILVTHDIPQIAQPIKQGAPDFPSANHFERNNLTAFTATWAQLSVDHLATGNTFAHNCYGDVNPPATVIGGIAGALVQGDKNILGKEDFHGNYAGKYPLVLLDNGAAWPPVLNYGSFASEHNYVRVFHNGKLATCNQIIDQNWELTGTTTNWVPGCKKGGSSKQGAGPIVTLFPIKVPFELRTGAPVCPSLVRVPPPSPPEKNKKTPVSPGPPSQLREQASEFGSTLRKTTGATQPLSSTSMVDIQSGPAGADIIVDGKFFGSTPSVLTLPAGEHSIEIRKAGYKSWQRTVTLTGRGKISLAATLKKGQF